MLKKGKFPLPNGGKSVVDVTAVENVIHAILLFVRSENHFDGEIINITNGESKSVKELMESLQQEFDQTISKGKQTLQGLLK